ncbi:hypothetical protein [uncultured Photobacterium sp.]|uniref:hypothetical protein n=1 Tax=uncultured Photobacterium sp. TaxID=173973 RepID=UPI002612C452|nr:hypothetical protein [uncultured Photobacterium sp.]
MKKTITTLAIVGLCAMSAGAFAKTDTAHAVVTWSGTVPGVLPGNTLTITGLGKGAIPNGVLNVEADGTFASQTAVILESHTFDDSLAEDKQIGDLVDATWSLTNVSVSPATYDKATVKVKFNGVEVAEATPMVDLANTVAVEVRNEAANADVTPTQAIQVTTTAMASVTVA